jgi:hypothetical protein
MPKHYVLCQHGLFGNGLDFKHFESHFSENENIQVVVLTRNSSPVKTLDGIAAAGNRCFEEILEFFNQVKSSEICYVSILGHSMGGLILRFAIRRIEMEHPEIWTQSNVQRKIAFFLACPHVGISNSSWLVHTSSQYVLRHLSRTASDLTLHSSVLVDLCDNHGIQSLNSFERVIFIANSRGDRLVSSSSAMIIDPGYPVPQIEDRSDVVISEYTRPTNSVIKSDMKPQQQVILEHLNEGLKFVTRYLVTFPPAYPSFLSRFDNTAHTKIICHGLLDRSKMGFPIILHVAELMKQSY